MKKLNLIIMFNENEDKVLMCKRAKDPYKGLYNLVGGKLENGENELAGAYRELQEETGITTDDTILYHMMDYKYYIEDTELQVFIGKLNKEKELVEELNKLEWLDKSENFFDSSKFAGDGNIGHMIEEVYKNKENIWKK